MKRLNWVLLVLMATSVGVFLAGCSRDRTGSRASENKMTNSDLKDAVEGKLKADPELRAADLSVSADADNNEVKLSGKVDSEALRSKAIEVAKSAHPGLIVTDKIDVEPRELGRSDNGMGTSGDNGSTTGQSPNDESNHARTGSSGRTRSDSTAPRR